MNAFPTTQLRSLVENAVKRGLITIPQPRPAPLRQNEEYREQQRILMRRLRAERRGQDLSAFPPRLRRAPQRLKGKPNPIIECACGCGRTFAMFSRDGKSRKFARGHWLPL